MRVVSPGARVGRAWEKACAMDGTPLYSAAASSEWGSTDEERSRGSDAVGDGEFDGRGMGTGRLGFFVAEVRSGGRERKVDVKQTLCKLCVFCNLIQHGATK